MRAFWSRKNNEDDERYRQRTVGRLRGLAVPTPGTDPNEPDHIRDRIERMMRDFETEPAPGSEPA